MGAAEVTSRTAWIVALLLGAQASLGRFRARALPATNVSSRPARTLVLTGHAVIGFALPVLTFSHAWSSMKLPGIRQTSSGGLWMATVALMLLVAQAVIGTTMLRLSEAERVRPRRLHLAVAVVLVVLAVTHVILNG